MKAQTWIPINHFRTSKGAIPMSNEFFTLTRDGYDDSDVFRYLIRERMFKHVKGLQEKIEFNKSSHFSVFIEKKDLKTVLDNIRNIKEYNCKFYNFGRPYIITDIGIADFGFSYSGKYVEVWVTINSNHELYKRFTYLIKGTMKEATVDLGSNVKVNIDWYYTGSHGVNHISFTELIQEIVHDEAYPEITKNSGSLDNFITSYLESESPVLIMMGKYGMGKSRLIRHIIAQYEKRRSNGKVASEETEVEVNNENVEENNTSVIYTSDKRTIEKEEIFINFRRDKYTFMVMEDMDSFLTSRKEGQNEIMNKFLASSDGFLPNRDKKIIMTTNLNVPDIDKALLRPGRCFASIEMNKLERVEAEALLKKIDKKGEFKLPEQNEYTVADVYRVVNAGNGHFMKVDRKLGFGK